MEKALMTITLFLFFLMPTQSLALSCAEPSSPDRAYREYDAVIIGTVEKIKDRNSVKILTIRVNKSFKGVDEKMITVKEDIMWGESQLDANYLYYLNAEGGKWIHPLCSPTTGNTDLADEVFADKKEIALRDGNLAVNDTRGGGRTLFLEMMIVILATSRLKMKK